MCQTLNCCTIFSIGNCILQELDIKRMIYLSSRVKGLHRLQIYEPHLASQVKSQNLAFQTTSRNLATKANTYNTTNLIIKNNTNNFVIPKYSIWYFRLVHVSHNRIRQMSQIYSSFELLHFDIWRPLTIYFVHNHIYFLTNLDEHTRFVWTIMLKRKYEDS